MRIVSFPGYFSPLSIIFLMYAIHKMYIVLPRFHTFFLPSLIFLISSMFMKRDLPFQRFSRLIEKWLCSHSCCHPITCTTMRTQISSWDHVSSTVVACVSVSESAKLMLLYFTMHIFKALKSLHMDFFSILYIIYIFV